MITVSFLLIIYITFISLGLPDSMIGVIWPELLTEFSVQQGAAGIITMTVSVCTVVSSFQTARLVTKFGTGKLVAFSVFLTALSMVGFSFVPHFAWFVVLAIPLGLGAGAIDTALNEYVAEHLDAHHMNWLHAFWGIGATTGPIILGFTIGQMNSWRQGVFIIGAIQVFICILLVKSLPRWKEHKKNLGKVEAKKKLTILEGIKLPGVVYALISFIFYVGIEATVGLWGSSFLIEQKGLSIASGSFLISLFYGSLTLGRVLSGFLSLKFNNKVLLIGSELLLLLGSLVIVFAQGTVMLSCSLVLIGLGCAAIFPTMLHETPNRFGSENSLHIMGFQMALAYVGTTCLPPLMGFLSQSMSLSIFPFFLIGYVIILLMATLRINTVVEKKLKL